MATIKPLDGDDLIPPKNWFEIDSETENILSSILKTLEKTNIQINKSKESYKWVLSEKGVEYATTDNS